MKLKKVLLTLSKGVFPKHSIKAKNDEIGEMTNALNRVISGLERTNNFAISVGAGQFDTEYEPLSEEDSLGKTLIKMRNDLAENERVLEQKVIERTSELIEKQKEVFPFFYDAFQHNNLDNTSFLHLLDEMYESTYGEHYPILPSYDIHERIEALIFELKLNK